MQCSPPSSFSFFFHTWLISFDSICAMQLWQSQSGGLANKRPCENCEWKNKEAWWEKGNLNYKSALGWLDPSSLRQECQKKCDKTRPVWNFYCHPFLLREQKVFMGPACIVTVLSLWENSLCSGAAHCLMSSAAGERSFIVKAPSVTAPPCGLCLHQQPGSLSIVRMVPWVRIILSKLYFTRFFMPLLLISLFHRQRGSNRISLSLSLALPLFSFHFLLPRSPTPLPSQADWLSSSCLLHNTGHFQFSSFSFKRAPLCLFPTLVPPQPLPTPTPVSLGSLEGRRGQS